MKFKLAILVLIAVLAASLSAAPPRGRQAAPQAARVDNAQYINANRILMFVTNHGNFGRDLSDVFGYDAGTFYPYPGFADHQAFVNDPDKKYALYAAGLWVGGKVNGDTRIAIAEYSDEYVPGPMAGGTFQTDSPEFRIYKLYRDSLEANPNQDYLDWPVDQGAPVDSNGNPELIGDMMLWAVYNDADPAQHDNDAGSTLPLGLEVQHTTFAFNQTGPLGDMVFFRLRVFNKGGNTIDSCFFSLWADPDLGDAADDLVGSDTTLSLGYVYNADNDDSYYAAAPPALGFDFFQGPLVPSPGDTARMWGQQWPDMRNLGMYSFNKYINGTDPNDFTETYNYMRGLNADGTPYVYNGNELLYVHSGDPRRDINDPLRGDVDINPADRRWMQSTGPLTFAPGDSTELIVGIIVGQGGNRLQSITQLLTLDDYAQRVYENDFQVAVPPAAPVVDVSVVPGEVIMTWGDTSEVDHGTYPFQGYTVWQCQGNDCIELATYDVIDDTLTQAIIDTVLDPYSSTLQPTVLRALDNKGLRYQYRAAADAFTGFDIWDVTTYQFRVTAFSFATHDSLGELIPFGDRFKESATNVTVTPQDYMPGVNPVGVPFEMLEVTHTSGLSDVVIAPYILNPIELNGHTYRVTFDSLSYDTTVEVEVPDGDSTIMVMRDTVLVDTAFILTDLTANKVLVSGNRNLSGEDRGEEPYRVFDGIQLVVSSGAGLTGIREVAGAGGAVITPSDNVMYSLNSTGDWYVDSDQPANFSRINWRGKMGISDWEFRWGDSSYGYDWNTDMPLPDKAPFSVWNVGIGTFDDPSDDVRLQWAMLDDDASGADGPSWTYGDRIYVVEREYVEPLPAPAEYIFDDEFEIGRIRFMDNSEETTSPAAGTVVRFTTAKPPTPTDTFTFVAQQPGMAANESELDGIRVVPNPFYLYGPYDGGAGAKTIRFHGLPAQATIEIYNLGGEFIERIEKNDATTSIAEWDALTSNNLPVASGIYIYVVDAPGFGQKVGKFAVFTEVEVLRQY